MKQIKQIKRAAGVIAGGLIFIIIVKTLNYMYMDNNDWGRILWHSFYTDRGKIDNLYLGSSHVYCDLNPYQLDQLNGQYNFNLSTPGQTMNGTYYLLREADQCNRLSHVYVELCYWCNVKNNFDEDKGPIETNISYNWENTDCMQFSFNKLQYMITMAAPEKYPDIFLGFSRYRKNLDDWTYVAKIIEGKESRDYFNFQYHSEWEDRSGHGYTEFLPKGRYYSSREWPDEDRIFHQEIVLKENPMAETSKSYLEKVIAYCREREIPVTLFISPVYELQLISTEHYDYYLDQVREIAEKWGVDVYDFNLAKEEFLPIQEIRYFMDIEHLNGTGAEIFTEFFHKIMSSDAAENRKYFYDSYEQKLAHAEPEVYGIYYCYEEPQSEDEIPLKDMFIASNRDEGMEYRVIMTPGNEKAQYQIQDFSENKAFKVSSDEHGTCTIMYRIKNGHDEVHQIEITY